LVDAETLLERLADVTMNVVCFRYVPAPALSAAEKRPAVGTTEAAAAAEAKGTAEAAPGIRTAAELSPHTAGATEMPPSPLLDAQSAAATIAATSAAAVAAPAADIDAAATANLAAASATDAAVDANLAAASAAALDVLNARIVAELQLRGLWAPSTTRLQGRLVIRCCLVNHRTKKADLADLVAKVLAIGRELSPPTP
jgi:glutamate/tyrosine decarboxylase-like PLP-dependent enzyme